MVSLLYGSGLRLAECATLRVREIDFPRNQIVVHDAKVTLLPSSVSTALGEHQDHLRNIHLRDKQGGYGRGVKSEGGKLRTRWYQPAGRYAQRAELDELWKNSLIANPEFRSFATVQSVTVLNCRDGDSVLAVFLSAFLPLSSPVWRE